MRDKLDKALALKASEGDVNAYEKIMEYSGLSVRLSLKEEELQIKSEELKLKKSQVEDKTEDSQTAAIKARAAIWAQVHSTMEKHK